MKKVNICACLLTGMCCLSSQSATIMNKSIETDVSSTSLSSQSSINNPSNGLNEENHLMVMAKDDEKAITQIAMMEGIQVDKAPVVLMTYNFLNGFNDLGIYVQTNLMQVMKHGKKIRAIFGMSLEMYKNKKHSRFHIVTDSLRVIPSLNGELKKLIDLSKYKNTPEYFTRVDALFATKGQKALCMTSALLKEIKVISPNYKEARVIFFVLPVSKAVLYIDIHNSSQGLAESEKELVLREYIEAHYEIPHTLLEDKLASHFKIHRNFQGLAESEKEEALEEYIKGDHNLFMVFNRLNVGTNRIDEWLVETR